MASTNKTTNYELSQFVETDRPAWLTDYNGDMRTLDAALKAVSDVASGASGSISELADRMSTAEGNITTNTNDIATLDARADSLEAQAQSTAGTIANIQTEQTAQNLGIEAATELGYNLARPYDSASTYAVGDYVLFQNTLYKCITAVTTGEAFVPAKWLAIKVMDEIGGETDVSLFSYNGANICTLSDLVISNPSGATATLSQTVTQYFKRGSLNVLQIMFTLGSISTTGDTLLGSARVNWIITPPPTTPPAGMGEYYAISATSTNGGYSPVNYMKYDATQNTWRINFGLANLKTTNPSAIISLTYVW